MLIYGKPLFKHSVIIAMNRITCNPLLILVVSIIIPFSAFANVGAIAGSNIISIGGGSSSTPTYKIVSASIVGDPVFSGTIDSVNGAI